MSQPGFLLLAAGSATRFGSHKLTAMLDDKPVIQHCLDALLGTGYSIAVVYDANDPLLAAALPPEGILPLPYAPSSPNQRGMGHSIAYGVSQTRAWQGWVICQADMPWVQRTTYSRIATNISDTHIVRPWDVSHQAAGHPVGFGARYRQDLLNLTGDCGAKSIVSHNKSQLSLIEVEDYGILLDIDLPSDLNRSP